MTAASVTKSRYTVTLLALESISHGGEIAVEKAMLCR